jgi:ferrous iron transport protein A
MQLSELKPGQKAIIQSLSGGEAIYRQRLIAMGLIPGTELVLSRVAPLGDPVEIKVRGSAISLRKQEAAILNLEMA